jgi:UDP-glucose 4-epimerase
MFAKLWDVRVSVLQIAMVYGPAQRDLTKLVPYVTLTLLRGNAPQLSSGTRLVDWVYVDDVVDALLRTAKTDAVIGEVFDICSGRLVSIRDTVELLAMIIGGEARAQFSVVADRPMDLAQRGDPGPAASLLDWRASTPLETGLRETVAWYSENVVAAPLCG